MSVLSHKKYPVGVMPMLVIQLVSMIAFVFVTYLLVLYATNKLGFSNHHAYTLVAAFIALMYGAHVSGGLLAEKSFGHDHSVIIGIVLSTIGSFGLLLPSITALYVSLSLFIVGSGLFIPCLFVLLGRLYQPDHPYRQSGFLLIYVGMNIGSLIAASAQGPLLEIMNYRSVFLIGAIAQIILLLLYLRYRRTFQENAIKPDHTIFSQRAKTWGWIGCIASIIAIAILLDYARIANVILIIIGALCAIFVAILAMNLQGAARKNLWAFLILVIVALCFWALYMLNTTALVIFIEHNVNRQLLGWTVPTASFSALNPFFILIVGFILMCLWGAIYRWRQKSPSIPLKFVVGLIFAGLGYLVLVVGIHHGISNKVPMIWIVLCYLMLTIAELLIAPVGFAMVGKLVPERMEAFMVGIWELSTGVAAAISGYLAYLTITPPLHKAASSVLQANLSYEHSFITFGVIACVLGIVIAFFVPWLNRLCASK